MKHENGTRYIPPFRVHALTPLYDFCTGLVGLGESFKASLLSKTRIQDGQSILDIGCGTGVLAVLAKKMFPHSRVVGIDPDEAALRRAAARAKEEQLEVQFQPGSSDRLPFTNESFDVAISTLAFHHMPAETKMNAAKESYRVLRPGGCFYLFDFKQRKKTLWNFWTFIEMEHARDNYEGKLPVFLKEAGFKTVTPLFTTHRLFEMLEAKKP